MDCQEEKSYDPDFHEFDEFDDEYAHLHSSAAIQKQLTETLLADPIVRFNPSRMGIHPAMKLYSVENPPPSSVEISAIRQFWLTTLHNEHYNTDLHQKLMDEIKLRNV